jgi:hypothetical protein
MRNEFDLSGELWRRRTVSDDLDICLSPAETANGLRRMNDILNGLALGVWKMKDV